MFCLEIKLRSAAALGSRIRSTAGPCVVGLARAFCSFSIDPSLNLSRDCGGPRSRETRRSRESLGSEGGAGKPGTLSHRDRAAGPTGCRGPAVSTPCARTTAAPGCVLRARDSDFVHRILLLVCPAQTARIDCTTLSPGRRRLAPLLLERWRRGSLEV